MSNYTDAQIGKMADSTMEPTVSQAKQLVSPEQLAELMERRDLPAWIQCSTHFGASVVCGYYLYTTWGNWWLTVPLFMIQGILLSYMYAGQHEMSHKTAFRTPWLNTLWGHIFGFIGFITFWFDRTHHMMHHQWTGVRSLDQELVEFRFEDRPFTTWSYLRYLSSIDYFFTLWGLFLMRLTGGLIDYEKQHFSKVDCAKMMAEAWAYMVGYSLIAYFSVQNETWIAVQVWLAPMISMKWVHQAHNMTEHYGLPKVADMPSNTRTIYTTPINRWLVWNMNYHTGHHRFANVPFYNTPKLDRLIRPEVKHSTMGYLKWHKQVINAALAGKRYGYEGLM